MGGQELGREHLVTLVPAPQQSGWPGLGVAWSNPLFQMRKRGPERGGRQQGKTDALEVWAEDPAVSPLPRWEGHK